MCVWHISLFHSADEHTELIVLFYFCILQCFGKYVVDKLATIVRMEGFDCPLVHAGLVQLTTLEFFLCMQILIERLIFLSVMLAYSNPGPASLHLPTIALAFSPRSLVALSKLNVLGSKDIEELVDIAVVKERECLFIVSSQKISHSIPI